MSVVVPAPESSHRSDIDLSDAALPVGPILEAGTRFAVRIEAAVYKIVEEALTNVMRHASARSVTISLNHGGGTLTVVIADDGDGFEPDHRALTPGSGMGLLCMEERGRLLDGTVRIRSAPGQGTVVEAALPVPPPGSAGIGLGSMAAGTSEVRR